MSHCAQRANSCDEAQVLPPPSLAPHHRHHYQHKMQQQQQQQQHQDHHRKSDGSLSSLESSDLCRMDSSSTSNGSLSDNNSSSSNSIGTEMPQATKVVSSSSSSSSASSSSLLLSNVIDANGDTDGIATTTATTTTTTTTPITTTTTTTTKLQTPQSDSIKNHLRRKSIPNDQLKLIEQRIANIISQNQAIVDNCHTPWTTRKSYSPRDSKLSSISSSSNSSCNANANTLGPKDQADQQLDQHHHNGNNNTIDGQPQRPFGVPRKRWSTTNPPHYSSLNGSNHLDNNCDENNKFGSGSGPSSKSDRQVRSPRRRASLGVPSAMCYMSHSMHSTGNNNSHNNNGTLKNIDRDLLQSSDQSVINHSSNNSSPPAHSFDETGQKSKANDTSAETMAPFSNMYNSEARMVQDIQTFSPSTDNTENLRFAANNPLMTTAQSQRSQRLSHHNNDTAANHVNSIHQPAFVFNTDPLSHCPMTFGCTNNNNNGEVSLSSDHLSKSNSSLDKRQFSNTGYNSFTGPNTQQQQHQTFLDLIDNRQAEQLQQQIQSQALAAALKLRAANSDPSSLLNATSIANYSLLDSIHHDWARLSALSLQSALFPNGLLPPQPQTLQTTATTTTTPSANGSGAQHSLASCLATHNNSTTGSIVQQQHMGTHNRQCLNGNEHSRPLDMHSNVHQCCVGNAGNLGQHLSLTADQQMMANRQQIAHQIEETLVKEFLAKMQSDVGGRMAACSPLECTAVPMMTSSLSTTPINASTASSSSQASQSGAINNQSASVLTDQCAGRCRRCGTSFISLDLLLLHESYCCNLTQSISTAQQHLNYQTNNNNNNHQHNVGLKDTRSSSLVFDSCFRAQTHSSSDEDEASSNGQRLFTAHSNTSNSSPLSTRGPSRSESDSLDQQRLSPNDRMTNKSPLHVKSNRSYSTVSSILKQQLLAPQAASEAPAVPTTSTTITSNVSLPPKKRKISEPGMLQSSSATMLNLSHSTPLNMVQNSSRSPLLS